MRRGFATAAAESGATLEQIAKHGGWTRLTHVMRYIDRANLHKDNPGEGLLHALGLCETSGEKS